MAKRQQLVLQHLERACENVDDDGEVGPLLIELSVELVRRNLRDVHVKHGLGHKGSPGRILSQLRAILVRYGREGEAAFERVERLARERSLHALFRAHSFVQLEEKSRIKPPRWATFLVEIFAPESQDESLLGDLAEEYYERLKADDRDSANSWYVKEAASSLIPLVAHKVVTNAKKIWFFGWLLEKIDDGWF